MFVNTQECSRVVRGYASGKIDAVQCAMMLEQCERRAKWLRITATLVVVTIAVVVGLLWRGGF